MFSLLVKRFFNAVYPLHNWKHEVYGTGNGKKQGSLFGKCLEPSNEILKIAIQVFQESISYQRHLGDWGWDVLGWKGKSSALWS